MAKRKSVKRKAATGKRRSKSGSGMTKKPAATRRRKQKTKSGRKPPRKRALREKPDKKPAQRPVKEKPPKDKQPPAKKPPGKKPKPRVWKVYVSGFHDWPASKKEAQGFNRWRCEQNPSGRLFIGRWYRGRSKPDASGGELPRLLKAITKTKDGRSIEWTFDTLPVLWGVAKGIKADQYDVVVNTGYGVYDSQSRLRLEKGAYNRRSGQPDAAGRVPGETEGLSIKLEDSDKRLISGPQALQDKVNDVAGAIQGTNFTAQAIRARASNDYICNETHFIMLGQVKGNQRLRQAYFIHIPKPKKDGGYAPLAKAMAKTIERLIQP